ncbi:MAG: GNAT family N-acetyltransferase [Flavobacteriales bacterium]|nr:GNAT family N-acetyltransferase [Flavobacteriales bacterium]
MYLEISSEIYLSPFAKDDAASMALLLNDKVIHDNTLSIPYPYTIEEAYRWIDLMAFYKMKYKQDRYWAIRDQTGLIIGAIGFVTDIITNLDCIELGYWLGKPYRGKGIMTQVVSVFSDHAIATLGYKRVEAPVYPFNSKSSAVLIRSGFKNEGLKKNYY